MKKSHFLALIFFMASFWLLGADQNSLPATSVARPFVLQDTNMASCNSKEVLMSSTDESFFADILSTDLWPARWYCGVWTDFHGWLYICSDLLIWAAYFIIPLILGFFLYKRRKEVPFHSVLFLFIAFILACGLTHLIDAVIFWWPAYKLSAVIRFGTAIISWGTVIALVKITPKALDFKSPAALEQMVADKTAELEALNKQLQDEIFEKNNAQKRLEDLNEQLENSVEQRTLELKETNADLQHINSLFESVQEAANIGVWEIDLIKENLFWSDTVYDIHEVPRGSEVKLEEGINFYHDDYKETIQDAVAKGINEGVGWDLNLKLVTAKGRIVWVRAIGVPLKENGKTVKLRGLFQNIDEEIKSRHLISENRQNLLAIIENTENPIWSVSSSFKLTVFNKAFLKITRQVYGKSLVEGSDVFHRSFSNDLIQYWKQKYEQVFDTGKQLVWLEHDQSKNTYLEISLNPIIDKEGATVGISGVSRDVSQSKQQEANIKKVNDSLEKKVVERTYELNDNNIKLSAINKELESFSYSVSHDLRSPLRSVHGFTQALSEDYSHLFDKNATDYLNRILSATARMGDLIDDLLNLSRVSRTEVVKQQIDMSALVDEVFQSIDHGITTISITPDLRAEGDLKLIKAVLENLLGNGVKYSSKIANPHVEFGTIIENNQTAYYIKDNGAGFDMEYSEKLFTPFQRLHHNSEYSGNGIGLATVKRIINKHGGEVWAESQLNQGATFYFTLNQN